MVGWQHTLNWEEKIKEGALPDSNFYWPKKLTRFVDGDFFQSLFEFNFNKYFCPNEAKAPSSPNGTWTIQQAEKLFLQKKPTHIFSSTLNLFLLIDFVNKLKPDFSFSLITHQADVTISNKGGNIFFDKDISGNHPTIEIHLPSQINKWYSQNLNIKNDEFFVSLPIGLERKRWSDGYKHEIIFNMIEQKKTKKEHLVYSNCTLKNNHKRNINLKNLNCFSRGLCDFSVFAEDIAKSIYVLCPPGFGLDTHRAWESLYLGSYPIVENNYMNQSIFKGLPVLLVDDFNQLTNKFLRSKIEEMKSLEEKRTAKLTQEHYKELIFGKGLNR